MNPIDTLFQTLRAANRKAFMPFITAGDPDLAFTQDALMAMAGSGASLIEIGFPFSDPIADGPVIQAAYTRALNAKIKLADIFATLKATTSQPGWNTPIVAMVSYTLIYKLGAAKFIATAQAAAARPAIDAEQQSSSPELARFDVTGQPPSIHLFHDRLVERLACAIDSSRTRIAQSALHGAFGAVHVGCRDVACIGAHAKAG